MALFSAFKARKRINAPATVKMYSSAQEAILRMFFHLLCFAPFTGIRIIPRLAFDIRDNFNQVGVSKFRTAPFFRLACVKIG